MLSSLKLNDPHSKCELPRLLFDVFTDKYSLITLIANLDVYVKLFLKEVANLTPHPKWHRKIDQIWPSIVELVYVEYYYSSPAITSWSDFNDVITPTFNSLSMADVFNKNGLWSQSKIFFTTCIYMFKHKNIQIQNYWERRNTFFYMIPYFLKNKNKIQICKKIYVYELFYVTCISHNVKQFYAFSEFQNFLK